VHDVGGQDAAGLRGQELFPGRSGAPGRGADPVPPEYSIGRVDLPFLAAGLAR
jgi:hypothetical protein